MTTDTVAVWAEAVNHQGQPIIGSTTAPSGLPWTHSTRDLEHFREVTRDRVMLMGRKTFDLLPAVLKSRRSLEDRPMIVLTRSADRSLIDDYPGLPIQPIAWARDEALANSLLTDARLWFHKEVAVIGGCQVLELFAPLCDRLEVTFFEGRHSGDVPAPSAAVFDGFRSTQHTRVEGLEFVTFSKGDRK
ncbi:dihydrofolate reductase [Microbacterium phage AvGardian]|uniref:dihydrofolate reductase n=1 Tax=Microbacterium phage AvGardian TaxID=2725619 RepID=UPI0014645B72|nr:dihydrofolate reductase [Microbacterium phage AvGardian]QJD49873.1 dihydrofolate reductase [Microbacterium phage AvGardian]